MLDAVGAVPIVLAFVLAQQVFGEGGSLPRVIMIVVVMGWGDRPSTVAGRHRWRDGWASTASASDPTADGATPST